MRTFVALLTGCCLGDSIATRTVSLKVPAATGEPNIQPALVIVDGILVSHGFISDTNVLTTADREQGLVAFYGICTVSSKNDVLDINFLEKHKRHSSAVVQAMCRELRVKLGARYGVESVGVDGGVQHITVK